MWTLPKPGRPLPTARRRRRARRIDHLGLSGRELRHVLEPIATINFWSEPASAAYEAIDLDFLTGYVWARACVLGEPEASVVAAAFGAFDPGAVKALYDGGRAAWPTSGPLVNGPRPKP